MFTAQAVKSRTTSSREGRVIVLRPKIRYETPITKDSERLMSDPLPQQSHSKPSVAPELLLRGIRKSFAGTTVIDGLDLDVNPGEYLVVLGPSGCGKSTLLRIIAGLIAPDAGQIESKSQPWQRLPPGERDVSILFQDDRLYPHWNLRKNLEIALRRSPTPTSTEAMTSLTDRLGIGGLLDRRPDQISGGQLRRAALAKALLRKPSICLLDEPLTAIDTTLREDVLQLLADTPRDRGVSLSATAIIHVTHDGDEAMRLADRIAVIGDGRVRQCGTPEDVYRHPNSIDVASAIGTPPPNLIPMTWVRDAMPDRYERFLRAIPDCNDTSILVVRPESIRIVPHEKSIAPNHSVDENEWWLPVTVESSRWIAGRWLHRLRIDTDKPSSLVAFSAERLNFNKGGWCAVIRLDAVTACRS